MLVFGYLGAVIGAGFASGQEIVQFFVAYGNGGWKGVMLATVLFALAGGMLLYLAHVLKVSNYQELLQSLMGQKLGKIVDLLLAIFLFLGISTMFSASGAVFHEHFYLPKSLGIFLAYALVIIFLVSGKKGLIYSYSVLVPLKICLLLLIVGYAVYMNDPAPGEALNTFCCPVSGELWILASLLYVAYNFSLAMVVLTEYQNITSRREGISGAAWGGIVLGLIATLCYLALSKFLPAVMNYEVPMLFIAGQISPLAKYLYVMVLWVGILTTAIANAYGFTQRFAKLAGLSFKGCLLLTATMALPASLQSFSTLVGTVYPLFGVLGIVILSVIVYRAVKELFMELYYRVIHSSGRTKEV